MMDCVRQVFFLEINKVVRAEGHVEWAIFWSDNCPVYFLYRLKAFKNEGFRGYCLHLIYMYNFLQARH